MSKIYMATRDDVTTMANKLAASWESDLESAYTAIANAGGTVPSTKSIANLATAIATIPGDRLADWLNNGTGLAAANSDVLNLRQYAFYNSSNLLSISMPNCTTVGAYAFYGCTRVRSISFPLLSSCGQASFQNCMQQNIDVEVHFPVLTSLGYRPFDGFGGANYGASSIGSSVKVYLESLTSIPSDYMLGSLAREWYLPNLVSISASGVWRSSKNCTKIYMPRFSSGVADCIQNYNDSASGCHVYITEKTCAEIMAMGNFPWMTSDVYTKHTFHGSDGYIVYENSAWTIHTES